MQLVVAGFLPQFRLAPADDQIGQLSRRLELPFGHAGQIVVATEPLHIEAGIAQRSDQIGIDARAADIAGHAVCEITPDTITTAVCGQGIGRIEGGDRRQFLRIKHLIIGSAVVGVYAVSTIKHERSLNDVAMRLELDGIVIVRTASNNKGHRRQGKRQTFTK